ncbi:MAG: DNA recombination/repair protein RecA, partial [Candidatus Omnitrophota bacterium]|nr:DNA recombination/repair protein RecA [Candidatus Omnitrophota bacterium]
EFDIMFDEGISQAGSIMDLGIEKDIIQKSGAWLIYNQSKLGQGKEKGRIYLKENPKLMSEIEANVKKAMGI